MHQTWPPASGLNYGGVWICFKGVEAHSTRMESWLAQAGVGLISLINGGLRRSFLSFQTKSGTEGVAQRDSKYKTDKIHRHKFYTFLDSFH